MSAEHYTATLHWQRGDQPYTDNRYSRAHDWAFDGGTVVPASASPLIVPGPMSVPANVDPEEAFVASLASCHLLFFLDLARRAGLVVDDYVDRPIGTLAKDAEGRMAMTEVCLRPEARYSGEQPARAIVEQLHEEAHERCFIANSVRTTIRVDIVS